MLETKIIISYIALCLTYTVCRVHYLMTVKKDSELNDMLGELVDYAGSKDIIKVFVFLEILLCPILAPLSVLKQIFKFFFRGKNL